MSIFHVDVEILRPNLPYRCHFRSYLFFILFFSYLGWNFCFQASSKIGWMDVLRIAGRKTISTLLHCHWALDGRCPHTTTPSDGRRVSSLKMKWKYVLHICHGRCDFVLKYLMTVIILHDQHLRRDMINNILNNLRCLPGVEGREHQWGAEHFSPGPVAVDHH